MLIKSRENSILRDLLSGQNNNVAKIGKRERQFTIVSLYFNVMFFIAHIPLSIVQLGQNAFIYSDPSQEALNIIQFLNTVAFMTVYTFISSRFILNMIFNRVFREKVIDLVGLGKKNNALVTPTESSRKH